MRLALLASLALLLWTPATPATATDGGGTGNAGMVLAPLPNDAEPTPVDDPVPTEECLCPEGTTTPLPFRVSGHSCRQAGETDNSGAIARAGVDLLTQAIAACKALTGVDCTTRKCEDTTRQCIPSITEIGPPGSPNTIPYTCTNNDPNCGGGPGCTATPAPKTDANGNPYFLLCGCRCGPAG